MHNIFLLFISIFALFAISCTEKQNISKKEVQRVLNDFFTKNCILLPMDESEVFKLDVYNTPLHVKRGVNQYDFFEKLGYYELHTNENQMDTLIKTYKLTKKGGEYFITKRQRLTIEKGFCVGHYEAIKIKKFNKTDTVFNREALKVEFVSKVSQKCDFAKTSRFLETFQNFDSFTNTPQKAVLVLTKNGWKVK